MNKFTKLEDEILNIICLGHTKDSRGIYLLCTLAFDEKDVRKALNAMVKRGEIVRDKDKLYSLVDQNEPDVIEESSETKKEDPVLDVLDRHVRLLDLLASCTVLEQVVVDRVKRLYNDPEFRKFAVAYGKSGNAHSK